MHRRRPARSALAAVALCLALTAAGCAKAAQSDHPVDRTRDGEPIVGLLLPDSITGRWEGFDRPLIQQRIATLCPRCRMEYANAQGDVGAQQRQVDTMITEGVDVLILTTVDDRALRSSVRQARDAGVRVLAYDRLAQGPISAYVSFDGEQVGRLQARALLTAMRARSDRPLDEEVVVMMNGDPTDPNAVAFERGARSILEDRVRIGKAYDTPQWDPREAYKNMSGAIASLGPDAVDGVYAANDPLAFGVIAALKAAKVAPLPPVTGQDAELSAVQNILDGDQYMTVYKPFGPEADAAARLAVALARGEPLGPLTEESIDTGSAENVPAVLLDPIPVTAGNLEGTVVADGMYTIEEICTPKFRSACERAGLIG